MGLAFLALALALALGLGAGLSSARHRMREAALRCEETPRSRAPATAVAPAAAPSRPGLPAASPGRGGAAPRPAPTAKLKPNDQAAAMPEQTAAAAGSSARRCPTMLVLLGCWDPSGGSGFKADKTIWLAKK